MASGTGGEKEQLSPDLFDLLQRLCETVRSFIELYESVEERMQAIVTKLGKISEAVKELQKGVNFTRLFGAACGGFGLVVGVAALIAGVSSAGDRAAEMAALGCTAAFAGGTTVITANVVKAAEEKISIETVERLLKEFMAITGLLHRVLEEIKVVSTELEEKPSSLMTRTGAQAESGLLKTKQLKQLLKQTGELAEKSRDVMDVTLSMQRGVGELLNFITRIAPTCVEDEQLRKCITDSASQCEKTFKEFKKMRDRLKVLEEM